MIAGLATGTITRIDPAGALYVIAPALAAGHEQGPCTAVTLPGVETYAPGDRVLLGPLLGSPEPIVIARLPA